MRQAIPVTRPTTNLQAFTVVKEKKLVAESAIIKY